MESGDESGGGAGADELPLHAPRPRRALQVGEGRPGGDESRDNNVDDDNNHSSSRSGLFARLGWAVGAALRLAEAGLGALGLYSRFSYVREAVAAGELVLLQGDEGEDTRRPLEPAELEAVIGAEEEEEEVLEELDEEGERAYLGGEDAVVGGEDCLDEAGHVTGGCEDTGCSDEDGDDDDLVYGGGSDGEAA